MGGASDTFLNGGSRLPRTSGGGASGSLPRSSIGNKVGGTAGNGVPHGRAPRMSGGDKLEVGDVRYPRLSSGDKLEDSLGKAVQLHSINIPVLKAPMVSPLETSTW